MKTSLYRLFALLLVFAMLLAACAQATATEQAPVAPAATEAPKEEPIELTFWYWAELDAPGADAWMTETVEAYKKIKPNVTVTVVPQSTDTLISAFQAAATAKSGPDIASQWATGPVLGFVWQDALVPVSDYVAADEMKNWLNTNENTYNGKVWAAPMYLIGIDVMYNKDMFSQAGVTAPESGRWTWDEFIAACDKLKAAGITPWSIGDKDGYGGAWWFANFGIQTLEFDRGAAPGDHR